MSHLSLQLLESWVRQIWYDSQTSAASVWITLLLSYSFLPPPSLSTVEPEIEPVLEMYQFIAGQQEVSISFVSSDREYPPLDPSNVTMWFQRDDGNDGDNGEDEVPIVIMNTNLLQLSENGLTLTFMTVRPEHEGRYWVVATNDAGTTTSQPITVDVFSTYRIVHVHVHVCR